MKSLFRTGRFSLALLIAGAVFGGPALTAQITATSNTPVVPSDALVNLKYDNRYEIYAGGGYERFKAGPNLHGNAAMGGPDIQGTRWFNNHWGATGNFRAYFGTSSVAPTPESGAQQGSSVANYFFLAGPEYLGPRNAHAAASLHALIGGSYGNFSPSGRATNSSVGLFNNETNFAAMIGGAVDLNRSTRYALRISPDMVLTHYGGKFAPNFGISAGLLYRFKGKR